MASIVKALLDGARHITELFTYRFHAPPHGTFKILQLPVPDDSVALASPIVPILLLIGTLVNLVIPSRRNALIEAAQQAITPVLLALLTLAHLFNVCFGIDALYPYVDARLDPACTAVQPYILLGKKHVLDNIAIMLGTLKITKDRAGQSVVICRALAALTAFWKHAQQGWNIAVATTIAGFSTAEHMAGTIQAHVIGIYSAVANYVYRTDTYTYMEHTLRAFEQMAMKLVVKSSNVEPANLTNTKALECDEKEETVSEDRLAGSEGEEEYVHLLI